MKTYVLIFIAVTLILVPLAAAIAVHNIKRTIRKYTGGLLNLNDLTMLKRELERDASERPRSLSGMSSLYLPKIAADFPDFNYAEMKNLAQSTLISYLRAIDSRDPDKFTGGTERLRQSLRAYIDMQKESSSHENFDMIKIHDSEISRYYKDGGRCMITFQLALECIHNLEEHGQLKEGSRDLKYQTKYEMDLLYIQDREKVENDSDRALGYNCPNCGAPIKSLKYKSCEYCGCGIQEYNIKVWCFDEIREFR